MSIEVRGLLFRRPGFTLNVPRLDIPAGRLTAIVGPNGAGKTTFLKCLAGLLPAPAGTITIEGRDLASYSDGERARRMAFVPQEHASAFNYAVRDFILMGRAPYLPLFSAPSAADAAAAEEALAYVGLPGFGGRPYLGMSSGERRLVLIARALAQKTGILVLDEPTTFLDPRHEIGVMDLVKRLVVEQGKTVLTTLHNLDMVVRCADVLVFLKAGGIEASGPAADVLDEGLLRRVYDIPMRIIRHEGRTFIVK